MTAHVHAEPANVETLLATIQQSLEDDKAIDPVTIELKGKTALADYMIVATGGSQRHIAAMADKLMLRLKSEGYSDLHTEGLGDSDWVLIDANDVIVHLFREETRNFYDIERLWSVAPPERMTPRIVS
ncbi:MAG: ribosome silencing factor [Pseudomonadota bacterium]